jgi:hypothetical protein
MNRTSFIKLIVFGWSVTILSSCCHIPDGYFSGLANSGQADGAIHATSYYGCIWNREAMTLSVDFFSDQEFILRAEDLHVSANGKDSRFKFGNQGIWHSLFPQKKMDVVKGTNSLLLTLKRTISVGDTVMVRFDHHELEREDTLLTFVVKI